MPTADRPVARTNAGNAAAPTGGSEARGRAAPCASEPTPLASETTPLASGTAPCAYFEHDADFGIVGRGETVERSFENAARAMFAITRGADADEEADGARGGGDDDDGAAPRAAGAETIAIAFDEDDVELALVTWLNALLAEAGARRARLGGFRLRRSGSRWEGTARAEPWPADGARGTEVKGATLTMLEVAERGGRWEARCVVDV